MTLFTIIGQIAGKTALTEVTKQVIGHGDSWLVERLGEQLPKAQKRAQQNAAEFLLDLDARLKRLEAVSPDPAAYARRVAEALEDPDVVEAVKGALVAGARTRSETRHRMLANLISERLTLDTDSAKAAASQLALDAVKHLGAEHLALLGLLALIHVARPDHDPEPVFREDIPSTDAASDFARQTAERGRKYVDWLSGVLAAHDFPELGREQLIAHLVSAACVLYEPDVRRDLRAALGPLSRKPPRHPGLPAVAAYAGPLHDFLESDSLGARLGFLWRTDLQYLTPTPAGVLIGLAVHDAKTGEAQVERWEWSATSLYIETTRPDTGKLLGANFDDVVWNTVEQRLQRMASSGAPLPWQWIR